MSGVLKSILLTAGLSCAAFAANAQQMSGTVYIDANGTASTTVFKNWYSWWRSMQGLTRTDGGPTMTAGLLSSVTVEVLNSNTVAEASFVDLPATIGLSSTVTLTIKGNGNELWYSGTNAAIRFNGADYVTIDNLKIKNSNTTPGGIWLTNQADYNTISNCEIFLNSNTSANSSTYYISMSTSVTSPTANGTTATGTTGQPGSFNTFTGLKLYTQSGAPGPYYGVTLNGNSQNYSSVAQNNIFSNSTISNFNYMAVYSYYPNGTRVEGNDISRSNAIAGGQTTLYGVYFYYPYCTSRSSTISANNIHDLPFAGASTGNTNLSSIYGTYVYYAYGTPSNPFKMDGNTFKNIYYSTGSRYVNYIYYPQYIEMTNNTIESVQGTSTSSTAYDWYVYYPIGVRANNNISNNGKTLGYLYCWYIYYNASGSWTWNEFINNRITNNTAVNYMYSAYIYYYTGTNNWKVNNNYVVNNAATGSTGYHYFYVYYAYNYEVCNNIVAGNKANSHYVYFYNGLSGTYTAEIRNNTFVSDMTNCPTPSSAYAYFYFYLYYHTVWFSGNIIDCIGAPKNGTNPYYRYIYMYLSYANPSNLKEFDRNIYWTNTTFQYPYWYFNGTNYTDWAGLSASGLAGANDYGIDPLFIDEVNNDWRAGAWRTQNNVPWNLDTDKDALGVTRNPVRHDRGALETNTDIEAISTNFSVPAVVCAGYTTGTTNITVKSNYQYDKAVGFNVAYSVNGGPKTSATVTTPLALGDQTTVTFPTPLTLNQVGNNRITIFVDMPDDNRSNDTFVFNTFVKPAPGGGRYLFSNKPTQAVYQGSKSNDVTILGQSVIYNCPAPRVYSNGTYNTDWVASVYAKTVGGTNRPSSEVKLTAPAGTNDLEVQYKTADASMEDSMIVLYLKITDKNNGCDTIIQRQILIYPTVNVKFSFPTVNCDGDDILFENQSKVRSGSMEFLWDFGTGKTSDQTETPEPNFTFPKDGTYKVKLIAKTLPYGFPSQDSALITIRKKPTTVLTYSNACEGFNHVFSSTGSTSTASVNWNFGDNTSSTQKNPTKKYTTPGSYMVTLTTTENGCSDVVSKRVYLFDKPKPEFAMVSGRCDNDMFTFKNTSKIAKGTFGNYWNFDDGTVAAELEPVHVFKGSGNKSVKLTTISEFGCKDSAVVIVDVKESPKVAFTSTTACSLTPTEFTNETPQVGNLTSTYAWTFSDGGSSPLESPKYLFKSIGPKSVTLKVDVTNGCSAFLTKELEVGVEPTADFTAADVCSGSPVIFENKTTWEQGDISYSWNFGDGNVSAERAPKSLYSTSVTKTYVVTLTASIAGGCSDIVSKNVTVNEGPKTCDFAVDNDYGFAFYGANMKAIDANGNPTVQNDVTYTWVIEGGGNKSGGDVKHDFRKDGEYNVTMVARVNNSGCECSKTKTVVMSRSGVSQLENTGFTVYPNPSNGAFNVAITGDYGKEVVVEVLSMNGSIVQSESFVNNGLIQMNASNLAAGSYVVRVKGSDKTGTEILHIQN